MQFEGTTYRPPPEADSMLLQVTVGCAHASCTFCNMYSDVSFRVIKMEQIEADLKKARKIYPKAERVFLVNGDAFVLSARRLKEIAGKIKACFPECKTISMYASIRNIMSKTDSELRALKEIGINDLYVGVESGSDDVLAHISKGHTVKEAGEQLHRLRSAADIDHIANIMLGVAGTGKGLENARLTAAFLNETRPKWIWVGTLSVFEGTPLFKEIEAGRFTQASEREKLLEEKELINFLNLENIRLYADHPANLIRLTGILPRDRKKMIETIDKGIEKFDSGMLDLCLERAAL